MSWQHSAWCTLHSFGITYPPPHLWWRCMKTHQTYVRRVGKMSKGFSLHLFGRCMILWLLFCLMYLHVQYWKTTKNKLTKTHQTKHTGSLAVVSCWLTGLTLFWWCILVWPSFHLYIIEINKKKSGICLAASILKGFLRLLFPTCKSLSARCCSRSGTTRCINSLMAMCCIC